ncbi:MAG: hypothetical protein K0R38_5576, partial [Polyangiaceae bacterium]|nr:hypothetical protein [Polyangiaceae bacterium]
RIGRDPTLLITQPELLAALEARGLTLAALFGASAENNHELSESPIFAPLIRELESDVAEAARADTRAGVDVARYSHRLFDLRFLRSRRARLSLAGVVNRPDRAPFKPESCGETRLVYRLQYAFDAERASKLPMTLGVELTVPRDAEGGCRQAAERWLEPPGDGAEQRADWLRSEAGPLAPRWLGLDARSARVVVNLQVVRWPSTVRPDLGGHAEYTLRAFHLDEQGFLRPERLENTLDPAKLREPRAREAMLEWVSAHFAAVDAGTALLPPELLATRALSVTPRGLNRLANRPFSQALTVGMLRDLPQTGAIVRSPAGLLRRLDELSCQGCHQARSVAGFHLLGEDARDAAAENALAQPVSPQVRADLARRLQVAHQMLAGESPSFAAPIAERAGGAGNYGEACGLGADPSFTDWTCAKGLHCSDAEVSADGALGQCLPKERAVGDACERGRVVPAANGRRDHLQGRQREECPNMVCNGSAVGFPGGMCTDECGAPGSSCGAIAVLDPFNACLARGDTFLSCIRGNVRPAGLRGCDAERPCRDDYVCARGATGQVTEGRTEGVCLPPYFVFQLRVDGHSSAFASSRP